MIADQYPTPLAFLPSSRYSFLTLLLWISINLQQSVSVPNLDNFIFPELKIELNEGSVRNLLVNNLMIIYFSNNNRLAKK